MDGIKAELIYLSQNNLIFDEKSIKKLKMAIKYYFSRASSSVRDPEVIQLNHFVDDLRLCAATDAVCVLFSPSKVALPLAASMNHALVKDSASKVFFIDQSGHINLHALEYVLPVLISLFSCNSINNDFKSCGSLFIASLFLSVEITERLLLQGLSSYRIAYITVALITSSLLSIKKESLAYILDKLFKDDQPYSTREWLELIYAHRYPPYGHVYAHKCSGQTQNILSFFDQPFLVRNSPMRSPATENILFSLQLLSPLTTVICASLPLEMFESSFQRVDVSVNSNLSKDMATLVSQQSFEDFEYNLRWSLSCFLVWSRARKDPFSWLLYDSNNAETKAVLNKVFINTADNEDFCVKITVSFSGEYINNKVILLDRAAVTAACSSVDFIIITEEEIIDKLSATVGVDGTKILLYNVDHLLEQESITKAFSFVYERPGLD